jgi:hypothetical protein
VVEPNVSPGFIEARAAVGTVHLTVFRKQSVTASIAHKPVAPVAAD